MSLLGCCGRARAVPVSTPPEVVAAIRQLDDDTYVKREQATQYLWEAGAVAEPALREAAIHGDPEVRARAQRVLEKFRYGIYPGTPPEIADLVNKYHAGDSNSRLSIIGILGDKGGYGILILGRLGAEETDPALKANISACLTARAGKAAETAAILLAGNQADPAGRMLEEAVALSGDETAARAYAAYLLSTGALRDKAAALRTTAADTGDPMLARELAYLHRAAGDLDTAQAWAAKAGEGRLVENLQFERRDWAGLAKSIANSTDGVDEIRRTGLLAAVQRFAGDQAGFAASMARLRVLRKRPDTQGQVIMALLLSEQVDDAIAIHLDRKAYLTVFDLDLYTGRLADAVALADRAIAETHPDAFKLRALAARTLWRLGEQEKAKTFVEAAEAENRKRKDFGLWVYLCDAETEMGRPERGRAHLAAALDGLKDEDNLEWLFGRLFAGNESAAGQWWRFLRKRMPGKPAAEVLTRLTAVMEHTLPPAELESLAADAATASVPEPPLIHERWLQLLADTLRASGRCDAAAERYLDELAAAREARGEWAAVADRMAEKGDWLRAADGYRRAAIHPADFPGCVWLRGNALVEAGRVSEGNALIRQAKVIVLADERRRHDLAEVMAARGYTADAREQWELLLRTGVSRGSTFYDTLKQLGNDAATRHDYPKAVGYFEQFMLQVLDDGGRFSNETVYVELPQLVRYARARALLARGDAAGALAELRAYLAVTPVAGQLAIDLVPEFDKAGHRAEGDELFALVSRNIDRIYDAFPRSSYYHNEMAWACALCGREPEAGLRHARTAVELAPANTDYLDTLAEVHFRAGRPAEAEATMKKCIELEPNQDRHRRRLEGFKAGKGFSK